MTIIKKDEENFINIPVIQKLHFDKNLKRWIWRYYVQKMDQTLTIEDFVAQNKNFLIQGQRNIKTAFQKHLETTKRNMDEYRERVNALIKNKISNL